jgi:hypothetical protein
MAEILTREGMIQQMNVVAERALVLARRAKLRSEDKNEMAKAIQKEGISEEVYQLIVDAYSAGFNAATQPWMDVLKNFKTMPLYKTNGRHK